MKPSNLSPVVAGATQSKMTDVSKAPASSAGRSTSSKFQWKWLAKFGIGALVVVFLVLTLRKTLAELQLHEETLSQVKLRWPFMVFAVGLYMIGLFPAAIAWLQTLRSFGQNPPVLPALDAYFLGHLGKYVPGKAMVFIMRVGRLVPLRVQIKPAIVSVFVETLTSICTCAILGAILLAWIDVPSWLRNTGFLCVPFAMAILAPHFFRIGLGLAAKNKLGRMPKDVANAFTWKFMGRNCAWMLLGWLMVGTSGWLVLMALSSKPELASGSGWVTAVSAICLGSVAGFLSMLPGGAVVRELAITWLLAPLVSHPIALAAAILIRLTNIAGECLLVAIMTLCAAKRPSERTTD